MPNHQWSQHQSGKIQGQGLQCMEFVFQGVKAIQLSYDHYVTKTVLRNNFWPLTFRPFH